MVNKQTYRIFSTVIVSSWYFDPSSDQLIIYINDKCERIIIKIMIGDCPWTFSIGVAITFVWNINGHEVEGSFEVGSFMRKSLWGNVKGIRSY